MTSFKEFHFTMNIVWFVRVLFILTALIWSASAHVLSSHENESQDKIMNQEQFERAFLSLLELSEVPHPPAGTTDAHEYVRYLHEELEATQHIKSDNKLRTTQNGKIIAVGAHSSLAERALLKCNFRLPKDYTSSDVTTLSRVELAFVIKTGPKPHRESIDRLKVEMMSVHPNLTSLKRYRKVITAHGRWDVIDVTKLINSVTLDSDGDIKTTMVSVSISKRVGIPLRRMYHLATRDLIRRPLLVFYFNIALGMEHRLPPSSLHDTQERHRRSLSQMTPNAVVNQSTTTTTTIKLSTEHHDHSDREICSLHHWYVDFRQMGWKSWIIGPEGFTANYCYGKCFAPLLRDTLNTSNHAFIKSMYRATVGLHLTQHIPGAVCAPIKLSAISMLYINKAGENVLVDMPEMVADKCGCL